MQKNGKSLIQLWKRVFDHSIILLGFTRKDAIQCRLYIDYITVVTNVTTQGHGNKMVYCPLAAPISNQEASL